MTSPEHPKTDRETGLPLFAGNATHLRAGDDLGTDPLGGNPLAQSRFEENGQAPPAPAPFVMTKPMADFVDLLSSEAWMLDLCFQAAQKIITPERTGKQGFALPQGFNPIGQDQGPRFDPGAFMFGIELYKQTRERLKTRYEGALPPFSEAARGDGASERS